MTQSIFFRIGTVTLTFGLAFAVLSSVAFADHSEDEVVTSNAITVVGTNEDTHEHSEVVTTTVGATDLKLKAMEQLIAVLSQLIEALKHQLEHGAEAQRHGHGE